MYLCIHALGQNQLGSPKHAPTGSNLDTSYNNPQSTHQSKVLNQYSGGTAGGYGYDNTKYYAREEYVLGNLNPIIRPPTTREVSATNYYPNQYTGSSQSATYPLQSGAGYQHTASNSAPQYEALGDQPQRHGQSQSHKPMPASPPDCEPNQPGQLAIWEMRGKSHAGNTERYQPTPDFEPSHEIVVKTESSEQQVEQRDQNNTLNKT